MNTIQDQIEAIQEILRKTPHHKATNGFIGQMRAKIARLRDKQINEGTPRRQGSGGRTSFAVRKQGDATVVLVGPPSSGKSTLINRLTNAESKVAPYAFTTVTVIPGMLKYKDAYIQILDIPGLIEGAKAGKGRGREVLSVARGADLLIIMTDVERAHLIDKMIAELQGAGIRINQKPPNVLVEKRPEGGLDIYSNIKQEIDKNSIKEIAREYGIKNGVITLKERVTFDRLFDSFSESRAYIPAIFAVNKTDEKHYHNSTLRAVTYYGSDKYLYISAEKGIGIQNLIDEIWKALKFVTIYLVGLDDAPSFQNPMVVKEDETLADIAQRIGTDFAQSKKLVKIWGTGAKFPGQEVSLTTKVADGMQIRFLS